MTYDEIKELAKAAATAYVVGANIQDPKLAVDKFMEDIIIHKKTH